MASIGAFVLDVRGMRCPIPYVRAKALVPELGPGDTLIVRTTDPEAQIDLAALAADHGLQMRTEDDGRTILLSRP